MTRLFPRTAIAIATTVALTGTAHADWPAGGKLVSSPGDIHGVRNARITPMPNGDLFVLGVGVGGNSNTYNIQRLTHGGLFSPGWPASGVQLSGVLKGTTLRAQSIVVDDAARVWHTWPTANAMLESVDKNGLRLPANGAYFIGSSNGAPVHVAPIFGGEAYVTTGSNRIKRITPDGQPATGWTNMGVTLPGTGFHDNALLSDGSGGAIVFMRQSFSTELPIAIRILGNGVLAPGWSADGLTLSTVAPDFSDVGPFDSQLLPSGTGRYLAMWSLDAGSGTRRIMMQRFLNNGTLDPTWPVDGIEVVAPDTISALRALPDGTGGAYIVRQSHGRPVATHIASTGAVIGTANTNLLDTGAQYMPTRFGPGSPSTSIPDDMIADVTPDGGLLVGWSDTRLAPQVSFRLRWMTPSLTAALDKPAEPIVFFPGSPNAFAGAMLAVKADGPSGAFVAWSDYHSIGFDQYSGDVWMAYASAPVTAGVGASSLGVRLSAPRPNPATSSVALDLVLPDDSAARVELLDIAGRVQRTQVLEGAGDHVVTFEGLRSLAPGLYFARATSRHGSTVVPVVVTR